MCLTWKELQTNKLCQHSVCSLKCLFSCISIHFHVAPRLCISIATTWLISSSLLLCPFPSFLQLSLHACTLPAAISTPITVFLSLGMGSLPSWGPRWCSGESAGFLGFWGCRMAAWPFCGRYGRGQSWHLPMTVDQQGDSKAGIDNCASTQQTGGLTCQDVT